MGEEGELILVPVKVIEAKGKSALVEWEGQRGGVHRSFVPKDKLEGETISLDVLNECPLYGIFWEGHLKDAELFTVDTLADALRRAGIWTYEDLMQKDRVLNRLAINRIGQAVWHAARRATKEKGNG